MEIKTEKEMKIVISLLLNIGIMWYYINFIEQILSNCHQLQLNAKFALLFYFYD